MISSKNLGKNISLTFQILYIILESCPNVCHRLTTRHCDVSPYPSNISCSYHHIAQDFRQPEAAYFIGYETSGSPMPLKINRWEVCIVQTRVVDLNSHSRIEWQINEFLRLIENGAIRNQHLTLTWLDGIISFMVVVANTHE